MCLGRTEIFPGRRDKRDFCMYHDRLANGKLDGALNTTEHIWLFKVLLELLSLAGYPAQDRQKL